MGYAFQYMPRQAKNMRQNMRLHTTYILIRNKTPKKKTNEKAAVGSPKGIYSSRG